MSSRSSSKSDGFKMEAHHRNPLGSEPAADHRSEMNSGQEAKSRGLTRTASPRCAVKQEGEAFEREEEASEYFSMIGDIGASAGTSRQMMEVKLEDLGEIRHIFDVFDKDGNGVITANELRAIIASLGQSTTEAEVMDMVNSIDADGNGLIEFSEFLAMVNGKLPTAKSARELERIFRVFDADNSREINVDNLKRIFRIFGQEFEGHQISEMLDKADSDGDGKVGCGDFFKLMSN